MGKTNFEIDSDVIERKLREKGMRKVDLANELGITQQGVGRVLARGTCSNPYAKMIAIILECDVEEIRKKNSSDAPASSDEAAKYLKNISETLTKIYEHIDSMQADVDELKANDLCMLKQLKSIDKTCNEEFALQELDSDVLSGIQKKCTEINSGVNVVKGTLKEFKEGGNKDGKTKSNTN